MYPPPFVFWWHMDEIALDTNGNWTKKRNWREKPNIEYKHLFNYQYFSLRNKARNQEANQNYSDEEVGILNHLSGSKRTEGHRNVEIYIYLSVSAKHYKDGIKAYNWNYTVKYSKTTFPFHWSFETNLFYEMYELTFVLLMLFENIIDLNLYKYFFVPSLNRKTNT